MTSEAKFPAFISLPFLLRTFPFAFVLVDIPFHPKSLFLIRRLEIKICLCKIVIPHLLLLQHRKGLFHAQVCLLRHSPTNLNDSTATVFR